MSGYYDRIQNIQPNDRPRERLLKTNPLSHPYSKLPATILHPQHQGRAFPYYSHAPPLYYRLCAGAHALSEKGDAGGGSVITGACVLVTMRQAWIREVELQGVWIKFRIT